MHDDLVLLDAVKARKFLESLASQPFVTIVIEDGHLRVYSKGMTESESMAYLEDALSQMAS